MLEIDLLFSAEQWRDIVGLESLVNRAAKVTHATACQKLRQSGPHELAINLSDDAAIRELNQLYRGKDTPTNVLSFPFEEEFPELNPGPRPLGDIILAIETIHREAGEQEKELSHHIAHLVVHGVLHLFGYDHLDAGEADEMEALERDILATLDIPSPYRIP